LNSIFHYYVIQYLALRSNFSPNQAYILAYSSTYVDHNMVPETIHVPNHKASYTTIPTHHLGFWDPSQEMSVWKPFHFFPGGSKERCAKLLLPGFDRSAAQWMTLPNSDPVKELLIEALKTRNLYRIGIALHTFADSWAHQLFLGMDHRNNQLVKNSPIPSVGHAQAGRIPDKLQFQWTDPRRIDSKVDNWQIFKRAAKKIYRYLCTYQGKSFEDEDLVLSELESLVKVTSTQSSNNFHQQTQSTVSKIAKKAREFMMDEIKVRSVADQTFKNDDQISLDLRIYLNILPYNRHEWKKSALGNYSLNHEEKTSENQKDFYFWLKHELTNKYHGKPLVPKQGSVDFEHTDYYLWMEAAKDHLKLSHMICNQIC
jgi:hypothetical protein